MSATVVNPTRVEPRPSKHSTFGRDVSLIFRRSLAQARRGPVYAFGFPVAFPVLMIGLFSQLYGKITNVPGFPTTSYVTWMAPAVFLMAAMFGSGYSATGLVTDIETGYLDRLRLLPISPAAIIAGRLLFDVVRVLIAGTAVLGVSVALGADFHGGTVGHVGMLAVLALWTLGYTGLFYAVGLRSRSQQKVAVLIPLFLPISLLSTAYVPRQLAPGWIRTVSAINPYTHVVDAARQLMAGTAGLAIVLGGIGAGVAFVALTQVGSAKAFARLVRAD
jgi:ABC-2 type transport system permease protein